MKNGLGKYLVVPKTLSKYRNVQTEYAGIKFMSKKEANYAAQLDWQKKARDPKEKVVRWVPQVPFQVILNGVKICKYIADFEVTYADGRVEIVDVKGVRTDVYRLKKKLVEAQYGIRIVEV